MLAGGNSAEFATLGAGVPELARDMVFDRNSLLRVGGGTLLVLLIPLVLTIRDGGVDGRGWNWAPGDFLVMGALLFATGLALDLAWRRVTNPVFRVLACAGIVVALMLVWAELAVDAVSKFAGLIF